MTKDQIDNIFTYHSPKGNQPERYEQIRGFAKSMAAMLETNCPESREKSLAFTSLQQMVMWANASIAINENPVPEGFVGQVVDWELPPGVKIQ
jgi:hypothetical protein